MEEKVMFAIRGLASPTLDAVALATHEMATMTACTAVVVAATVVALWRGERRVAAIWLALGLSVLALEVGVKPLIGRPRPQLWPRIVDIGKGASFPSGHSAGSAAFFPFLAFLATRGQSGAARACALAAASGLSLAIGLGRMYLGVHWPTDVLAGWTLGGVFGGLAMRATGARQSEQGVA